MTATARHDLRKAIAGGLARAAAVGFVLAVPVFLLTTNVRLAFDSLALYRYGFEQYDAPSTTGLSMDQLMEVATEIRDYFNSSDELLDVHVTLAGEVRPLFNEREILHMRDVKGLVRGIYALQALAGVFLLGYAVAVLAAGRWRGARALSRRLAMGCLAAVGMLAVGGLASLAGFDQLFYSFHVISFTSGTWTFDPRYNYLTRLFTEGFFMQAALLVAAAVIVEALALAAAALGAARWLSNREAVSSRAAPGGASSS